MESLKELQKKYPAQKKGEKIPKILKCNFS